MAPEKTPELKAKASNKVSEDEDETRSESQPTEDEDIKRADHVTKEDEDSGREEDEDSGQAARDVEKPTGEESEDALNEDGENSVNKEKGLMVNEGSGKTVNEDEGMSVQEESGKPRTKKGEKGSSKKGRKTTNEDESKQVSKKGGKTEVEDLVNTTNKEGGKTEKEDGGKPMSDNKELSSDLANTISPVKELQTALRERREDERRAFDQLIRENVRLQRRLSGGEAKYQQLLAKYEVKNIELEAERSRTTRLEGELAEMKREMTMLIKAAKKAGVIGNASRKDNDDDPDRQQSGLRGRNGNASSPTKAGERAVWKNRITELEDRLVRLTEEDERKSRRLISLQRELLDNTRYIEALEEHVTDDVKESLSGLRGEPAAPEMVFTTLGKANNVVYAGRPEAYSYKNNLVQDSAVCVVS